MIDRESVAANDDKSVFLWFVYALWVLCRVAVRIALPFGIAWVVLQLIGCTPKAHNVRPEYSASVVDIVDKAHLCNGFAIATERGTRIATAAHCISGPVYYYQGSGPKHDATTETLDNTTDTALLIPSTVLQTLPQALPAAGERVHVTSTLGTVYGRTLSVAGRYYPTDLDIWRGWSGSPVMNDAGAAVGMLIRCVDAEAPAGACVRYSGIFVGLVGPFLGGCR